MDRYLTLAEAAVLLGVSPSRVQQFKDAGRLKCHKSADGSVRYKESEVLAFKAKPRSLGRPRIMRAQAA